ncbi:MAG: DUF1491 family protein [Novosphingobium sp.]|uniref:DUF1491 family protein n=1 Tax=Novosphingobium sp. TaxID=1874826 RepID=UPI001D4164FE|nr:DUF1491 family protein [Novosphingobium sp.]MCB2058405.1 DUF1491 family protein [Novosphingobium sp.]MCP5387139.1 DUF1491 family protein [Novosphingobium sp.]
MTARLPAHLEITALVRGAAQAGGFAAVLNKGEADAGTILVLATENGTNPRVFERMPSSSGHRVWHNVSFQDIDIKQKIDAYLEQRVSRDPDLWIIELDIANGERLVRLLDSIS